MTQKDRQRFDPILGRLRDGANRFGFAAELAPLSYEERPFSYLCRAAVTRRDGGERAGHVFIKIFKLADPAAAATMRARVMQDYRTTCDIHAFMSSTPGLGAVRPVACYEDLLTIVTEQADGLTLLDELQRHARWVPGSTTLRRLADSMRTVGRWLTRYQQFQPAPGAVAIPALVEYVDIRLRRLVERGVMRADERARILGHLEALGADVSEADLRDVSVHADLAPANILVSNDRIVVLDFAMATRGTALHDISRLYMQLELLRAKPYFLRRVLDPLQGALLDGFDPALTARHPLFRLLSMLHHVNHLGSLALRREPFPANLLSARVVRMHRRWIAAETAGRS